MTAAEQLRTVYGSISHLTEEQAMAIAFRCLLAREKGENSGTWHQSAVHFGRLDKCRCYPCEKLRAEAA